MSSLSLTNVVALFHVNITLPGLVVEAAKEVGAPGADKV